MYYISGSCCVWTRLFPHACGLERNRIRKHLLVFALAAPVLAMLTYVGLSQVCSS